MISIGVLCLLWAGGCWLGWQLLRQNGRILLRLEEVEKRLDESEFGEGAGSETPVRGRTTDQMSADPPPQLPSHPTGEGDQRPDERSRADRFSNGSLARSRIKRDGLKAGTPAPDFRLPCLDGSEHSLQDFRGRRVLLVFSDPHCGPCSVLAPELEAFHRACPEIELVMISRGEPKANRAKGKVHGLSFPVLLQQRWEISRLYAMFATPIAYLIDESGVIMCDVAVGVEAIRALLGQQQVVTAETQHVRAD